MEWILILFFYAGPMSKSDSVALQSVHGFQSAQTCQLAGQQASAMTENTAKASKFVCVKK